MRRTRTARRANGRLAQNGRARIPTKNTLTQWHLKKANALLTCCEGNDERPKVEVGEGGEQHAHE